jgi:hypothetical protein
VPDLDPIFVDHADRMSAQLDELTKTAVVIVEKDTVENPGPLDGFSKEPFLDPARALTGPDVGLIEALYNVVRDVWMRADDHAEGFQSGMGQVFSKWSGTAATECAAYVGNLVGFIHDEQQCLFTFAQGLTTYAAIIAKARESLTDLMGACSDGWDQATRAGEVGGITVAITALTTITGLGFSAVSGGLTLPGFGSALTSVAGTATNKDVDLGGKHADIANTYLEAAGKIIAEAVEAIHTHATPYLEKAREGMPHVPALPAGISDKGTFHPENEQSARLTGSDQGQPPGKIQDALG